MKEIKTSYYANLKNIDTKIWTPIAISGDEGKLVGFNELAFRQLSPYVFFKSWKAEEDRLEQSYNLGFISKEEYEIGKERNRQIYIEKFYNKVLIKLNVKEIYDSLPNKSVLLCFEKPTEFCHRFLVAGWLEYFLNLQVDELGYENDGRVLENTKALKSMIISQFEIDEIDKEIK